MKILTFVKFIMWKNKTARGHFIHQVKVTETTQDQEQNDIPVLVQLINKLETQFKL